MMRQSLLDYGLIPDFLARAGIRRLLRKRLIIEGARDPETRREKKHRFIESMKSSAVALHVEKANQQHYEVPTEFYEAVLGHRLKYSSCLWEPSVHDLDAAELAMLDLTVHRAGIENGMEVLELGCGWGSLSLYLAARFPGCRITAVSNSATQKAYIDSQARREGLSNIRVVTCDMNDFRASSKYDRIVSVEMFEHMRNYEILLSRIAEWLTHDGRLFVHIFVHDEAAYPFEMDGDQDWMARYFFTGGMMPSYDIFQSFTRDMTVEQQWAVNGKHYAKTLDAWLANMDRRRASLEPLFKSVYGDEWRTWRTYWRLFFMACSELFGYRGGHEWYVGHYLLRKTQR